MSQPTRMTKAEWMAEGLRRFGPDQLQWRFVCPVCGYVQSAKDYKDAGAPQPAVAFSCVGRWRKRARKAFDNEHGSIKSGPCDYAGGGLFRLNPVTLVLEDGKESQLFAFAEAP